MIYKFVVALVATMNSLEGAFDLALFRQKKSATFQTTKTLVVKTLDIFAMPRLPRNTTQNQSTWLKEPLSTIKEIEIPTCRDGWVTVSLCYLFLGPLRWS